MHKLSKSCIMITGNPTIMNPAKRLEEGGAFMADIMDSWQKIQQGAKEAERLINQGQYNLSMVKTRQTLEYMAKSLGERACIVDGDLSDIIDQLFEGQWITKSTRDHYHKLRMIGNRAVHEGNDSPTDANQAHHILSQEILTFANEYLPKRRKSASTSVVIPMASSRPRGTANPGGRANSGSRTKRRRKKKKAPVYDILRFLIPITCVILLIFIIRAILPDKEDKAPTESQTISETSAQPEESSSIEETSTDTPETVPPETTAPPLIYKATTTVNVRTMPSTNEDSRILVQLLPGQEVTVTGTYDSQWTIINYEGQDAYVATAYLTQ